MKANFEKSLTAVLKEEGGYANHPKDPGGATMKGVTQRVYDAYRQNNGKRIQSVVEISDDELKDIYYQQYWMAVKANNLPSGLDLAMFDYAVNSGPRRAIEHLQEVLNVTKDGVIGNVTISAANSENTRDLINGLLDRRMKFLKALSTFSTFGKGWMVRVSRVRAEALNIADSSPGKGDIERPNNPLPKAPDPKEKKSIGEVMLWIVGSLIAGIIAMLLGGK